MTDRSQISTSNLLSFINGNAVEPYGDTDAAKTVKPILESSMKFTVEAVNKSRDCEGDEKIGTFLITAYRAFSRFADMGLTTVNKTFRMSWRSHYNKWWATYAQLLEKNQDALGSTTNMKLPGPGDTKDVASALLNEISDILFRWYLNSLEELAAKENETTREEDAWTTEFREHILKKFENKLHLDSDAAHNDPQKYMMSRIIFVEQASQTGKRRLAQE